MDSLNQTGWVLSPRQIPRDVIIVGGSLSGLMHGIMLHRLGCSVRILEQSPTHTPASHMAGVALGADAIRFLDRFDRVANTPLGIMSETLQALTTEGPKPFLRAHRLITSWDALYFRLRANFDGLVSEYVPQPPIPQPEVADGETIEDCKERARFEINQQVVGIVETDDDGEEEDEKRSRGCRVQVIVRDRSLQGKDCERRLTADLVIGADGPNSIVRRSFVPLSIVHRKYSGYIAWRGVVPESQVQANTREVFCENITYSVLKPRVYGAAEGGHVIVYNIPGEFGSVQPGERLLNFCWYQNVPAESLDWIMTDKDGLRHHTSVAPNKLRADVWACQQALARSYFPSAYLEIIQKIESPFVHLITDYCSPQASFARGNVLLVGDASALLRPHIAFSTNQAAYQAHLTERLLIGDIGLGQWNYQVTAATYLHWRRSLWFGKYFQEPLFVALVCAVQYWAIAMLNWMTYWAGWLPKQTV